MTEAQIENSGPMPLEVGKATRLGEGRAIGVVSTGNLVPARHARLA